MVNGLKSADRARLEVNGNGNGSTAHIMTELVTYKLTKADGTFPDYEKLVPGEFNTFASFDAVEAIKAVGSLAVLAVEKDGGIDLEVADGQLTFGLPDSKAQAILKAETQGNGHVRVNGRYLIDALRASGAMVDFQLTNSYSPMLFSADGFKLVVMPMVTSEATAEQKAAAGVSQLAGEGPDFRKFVVGSLARHAKGDWGDLDDDDRRENELSLREAFRLLSAYGAEGLPKIGIITEADRSATTILFPDEY